MTEELQYEHSFGAELSPIDERDYDVRDYLVAGVTPDEANEIVLDPIKPILNQGTVNSCVAHTLAEMKAWQEMKERGTNTRYSTNFIYHNRVASDYQGEGMMIREALSHLKDDGVCRYDLFSGNYAYNRGMYKAKISDSAKANAKYQKLYAYASVAQNASIIKKSLLQNGPMVCVVNVTKDFNDFHPKETDTNKDYIKYNSASQKMGFHAILVIGCRTASNGKPELKIQNSWGETWGDHGTAWLSYDYPISELWTTIDAFLPPPMKTTEVKFTIGSKEYYVNGTKFEMDTVPLIKNSRTVLPVRFLASALSCSSMFYPNTASGPIVKITTITGDFINFFINSPKYYTSKDDTYHTNDVNSYIDENSRTMVPLRALAEAFEFEVAYDAKTKCITITKTEEEI